MLKGKIDNFNSWFALHITNGVSTMWCAYLFCIIALISLPDAIKGGVATTISWIAQTFIQLVLLSIIMVGQRVASQASDERAAKAQKASDLRAAKTYADCEEILKELRLLHSHIEEVKPKSTRSKVKET